MDIEIPGYTLLRTLGKGGMATVFLARQAVLERHVALKVMSKTLAEDTAFGERFMREAKIVSQLVHQNIVTVHEVGQHDGHYYLSMEYIDGYDLRTVRKRLNVVEKIRVVEDIARALHYAGEKGYVHRDIKPENIMFRSTDGSAVLTDFGIARAVENDLSMTQVGTAIGTPHYMSPEQAKGRVVDHRSDLYSLGIVFHLLLTGKVPYDADTAVAIGVKHITEPVPVLPSNMGMLQPIVDGLLAKNAQDRYQNGLALLNDLRNLDLSRLEQVYNSVDADIASAQVEGVNYTEIEETSRFTIEYNVRDTIERPQNSLWPSVVSSIFVVFALVVITYITRPTLLEPVITKAETLALGFSETTSGLVTSEADPVSLPQSDYEQDSPSVAEGVLPARRPTTDTNDSVVPPPVNDDVAMDDDSASVDSVLVDETNMDSVADIQSTDNGSDDDATDDADTSSDEDALPVVTETGDDVIIPDIPSLSSLQQRIDLLKVSSMDDPIVVGEYVTALNELLFYYPDNEAAATLLADLKKAHRNKIYTYADLGNRDGAYQQLNIYKARYPESVAAEWQALVSQVDKKLEIFSLLASAAAYADADALVTPPDANAISSYETVLRIDPSNLEAKIALQKISNIMLQRANQYLASDEYQNALEQINISLRANALNTNSLELRETLLNKIERQSSIDQALDYAAAHQINGDLYLPLEGNAYDQYQKVLALDPGNTIAEQGLNDIIDALSVRIWALVSEAKFEQARTLLARPERLMPDNERIIAMRAAINDVASP